MNKQLAVAAALLMLTTPGVWASTGSEGASFLDIPVGAGPAALGSAYSPLASDAYAPVYNPAGLGFLHSTQVAGQHLSYLESIHHEFLSFVHPIKEGLAFGLSAQYLGTGDIDSLDNHANPLGTFSAHYGAYNVSVGKSLSTRMALGLTAKLIEAKISDVSAMAFGADLGTLYKPTDHLNLSAGVSNIGSKLKFIDQADPLPLAGHLGAAYQKHHCLLSLEGVYSQAGQADLRTGLEWRPLEMVAIRTGYRTDTIRNNTALAGFSTGLGLALWGQEFSYAWVPYGDLGSTQYFSLLLKFGESKDERQNLIQYQSIKRHRTVLGTSGSHSQTEDATEPEYQQLMQLLNYEQSYPAPQIVKEP